LETKMPRGTEQGRGARGKTAPGRRSQGVVSEKVSEGRSGRDSDALSRIPVKALEDTLGLAKAKKKIWERGIGQKKKTFSSGTNLGQTTPEEPGNNDNRKGGTKKTLVTEPFPGGILKIFLVGR